LHLLPDPPILAMLHCNKDGSLIFG
jgi:hypothetical protein